MAADPPRALQGRAKHSGPGTDRELASAVDATEGRGAAYAQRARFYAVEYDETADHAFLSGLVSEDVGSVLEIPCGAGRNAGWLAGTGREVTLADMEPRMVEETKSRLEHLRAGPQVRTAVADMRRLDLGRGFDLILVPREAFQLLTNRREALDASRALRKHLNPSGKLFIDLATFAADGFGERGLDPSYFDPEVAEGRLVEEWSRDLPDGETLTRSRVQRDEGSTVRVEYAYELRENESVRRWCSKVRLRRYSLEGITELLEEAGMRVVEVYRNYRRTPYERGAARILVLAQRAGGRGDDNGKG